MSKKSALWAILTLIVVQLSIAQTVILTGVVRDAATKESVPGATVACAAAKKGAVTDVDGAFTLELPAADSIKIAVSALGFKSYSRVISRDQFRQPMEIALSAGEELEEVIISSARTNSRIEDLPVKVEVLGAEELEEEATLVPGGMGSLLGDLSIITIQRTGPVSGNDAVRMQGLAPGYTQLLQDGLPLYGGFSGSLGVLSIPPLDLRQVEIIKGSSSTLFGGGAIGGLINFLSKTPGPKPKSTVLLNQTTLGETDVNAFFSRKIADTQGFTFLATGARKVARDINSDGFAEVPKTDQILVHPRWFWGLGKDTHADVGVSYGQTNLSGGDIAAIKADQADNLHPYWQSETARRTSVNGELSGSLAPALRWTVRGAGSWFDRGGAFAGLKFKGRQINSYGETNVFWSGKKDKIVGGVNVSSEAFKILENTPAVPFAAIHGTTVGLFLQHDRAYSPHFSGQLGLRADHHSRYGWFVLPRISLLYKPQTAFSARLGYGIGYKPPELFTAAEVADFAHLQPLGAAVRADVAHSLNADINWRRLLWEAVSVEVNQAFYAVYLARPFEVRTDTSGRVFLENSAATGRVFGTDTYLQMHYQRWELYLGYNHTVSERVFQAGATVREPFNPQDKIAATLAWSIPEKWRFGAEAAFTGNQYVNADRKVRSFWFIAAMAAREFSWGTVVLNCENVGDVRQSQFESLVTGTRQNPVFSPLWGPVEGRVINLSVKIDW